MKSLIRSLLSGTSRFGLLSDIAMVTAAAVRVATRPPPSSSAAESSSGTTRATRATRAVPPGEWILVGGAAFRILRRIRTVRRNRRAAKLAAAAEIDD